MIWVSKSDRENWSRQILDCSLLNAAENFDYSWCGRHLDLRSRVIEYVLLGLVTQGDNADYRQVAPGVVVARREGPLLTSDSRLLGRIQIDRQMQITVRRTRKEPRVLSTVVMTCG